MSKQNNFISFGTASQFMHMPVPSRHGNRAKLTLDTVINHFRTTIATLKNQPNHISSSAVDVFIYYKLTNESNIIGMYYKTLIKDIHRLLAQYKSWSTVPSTYKTVALDNTYSHLQNLSGFKWSQLTNTSVYHIGDKLHLKRFIVQQIESAKLNYRTQRQLHKITNKNQLYKARIHGKSCSIIRVHTLDLVHIFSSILSSLLYLNSLLGNDKTL